uniref:ETS homologous factor n=1 Tax=Cynoglossus semilaevis TaxID=244447 RepID=A0A3P8W1U9_CYNSE
MSTPLTTMLENQLTTTWGITNSYSDAPMLMSGYTGRLWLYDSHPQFWSKHQVWEWLQQVMDMYQIDASTIPFQHFDMDGHQLCSLTYQDFNRAAGSMGPTLFHSITELKLGGPCHVEIGQQDLKPELDFSCPYPNISSASEENCDYVIHPLPPAASPAPSRPGPRGTHLWEFIRDILLTPERNPGLIKWEDRTAGVFRFLKSEAVAQLWGRKKNNSSMTYEKLSRAMRYYYKREILERVDGRRLVYKFGRNAKGWKESEK